MTQDAEGKRFGYDAENHQKEFFAAGNNGTTPDATYFYDGEGKRVKKISSTETVIFVYNAGGNLVAEYSTALAETQQVSYLTSDHLGSPRVITDQNGAVTTRKDYAAFGEETFTAQRESGLKYATTPTADDLRKGYTGYEKDDESGLDFAQARYYNSGHGRFTSVDPLTASANVKNPQTFNRYSYVLNSPYKFTDPLGLISSSTGANGQNSDSDIERDSGYNDITSNFLQQTQPTKKKKKTPKKPKAKSNEQAKPKVIDVRQDKNITAEVEKTKKAGTPLKEGETPVLTSVKTVVGETTVVKEGETTTVIDAYGNPETYSGGFIIRPVAFIPLDQGGNIYVNEALAIEESLTVVGAAVKPTPFAPQPAGGVFIDNHITPIQDKTTTVTQEVTISYFTHHPVRAGKFIRDPSFVATNTIVKSPSTNSITVTAGQFKKAP